MADLEEPAQIENPENTRLQERIEELENQRNSAQETLDNLTGESEGLKESNKDLKHRAKKLRKAKSKLLENLSETMGKYSNGEIDKKFDDDDPLEDSVADFIEFHASVLGGAEDRES